MIVKDRMTRNPIVVDVNATMSEAADTMTEKNLHRLPVIENGKLAGLVTKSLISSKGANGATSLSIFELNYLLNKTPVKTVMIKLKDLITIHEDNLLEEAALLMLKYDIGCLPVVSDDDKIVGILTQNDLFKAFLDLLGYNEKGSRVAVEVEDGIGVIGTISKIFINNNANISHLGVYRDHADDPKCEVVLRTNLMETDELAKDLEANNFKVKSIIRNK